MRFASAVERIRPEQESRLTTRLRGAGRLRTGAQLHQVGENVERLVAFRIDRRGLVIVAGVEIGIDPSSSVSGATSGALLRSPLVFASAIFPGYMIEFQFGIIDRLEREPINARLFLVARQPLLGALCLARFFFGHFLAPDVFVQGNVVVSRVSCADVPCPP